MQRAHFLKLLYSILLDMYNDQMAFIGLVLPYLLALFNRNSRCALIIKPRSWNNSMAGAISNFEKPGMHQPTPDLKVELKQ